MKLSEHFSLAEFLTFPDGGATYTSSAATITVDIYGRIVGFSPPDSFYFNQQFFTATSGQTLFTPTGTMSNVVAYANPSVVTYSFNFNALSFDLFINGCLMKYSTDYTTGTNSYVLTNNTNGASIMQQQTFASVGAA